MKKLSWAILVFSIILATSVCSAAIIDELTNAVKTKDIQKINELVSKGADINASDSYGATPLIYAVAHGQIEIVKLLIDKGAKVNAEDSLGEKPLFEAVSSNSTEIAKLLIDKGANVNSRATNTSETVLDIAEFNKNSDMVKLLKEAGAKPKPIKPIEGGINGELLEAAENNETQKVSELISKGADVNAKSSTGWTPLMNAAFSGATMSNAEIVKLLIDKGADVNAKNSSGGTALNYGARDTEIAKLLIDKGADVNAKDSGGWTPLMYATCAENNKVVKLLLDKGADANVKTPKGETPLLTATSRGLGEIAILLIEKGADVNAKDSGGWTPLMYAVLSFYPADIPKLLIDKGADINAKGPNGETPLMLAVTSDHAETLKLLIDKGANVNAKNSNGETALSIAESRGDKEIVKLLKMVGTSEYPKTDSIESPEKNAVSTLRSLETAIETFRISQSPARYPSSLKVLYDAEPSYIDAELGSGKKTGYIFTYTFISADKYTCIASPEKPGIAGNKTYFVDETGVIKLDNADGAPVY